MQVHQAIVKDDEYVVEDKSAEKHDDEVADLQSLLSHAHQPTEPKQHTQQSVEDALVHEVLVVDKIVFPLGFGQDEGAHEETGCNEDEDSKEHLQLAGH